MPRILAPPPFGVVLCALLVVLCGRAAGQGRLGQGRLGGRIPVRVVEGKLVTLCDVSGPRRRLPVHLFVEVDTFCGLALHNQATAPLGVENRDGTTRPIHVHFGDFELTFERREHGDEELYEEFTKYHSTELQETAVVGVLGAEAFREWRVTYDLAAGYLELAPEGGGPAGASAPADPPGTTRLALTVENELAWLPVRYADGTPAALAIGTARYDTLVDRRVAEAAGRPAGDLPGLFLGPHDLTRWVALRPEEVVQVHPDGVAGVLGLGLLESFRIEVDRAQRTALVTPTRAPAFPEADLAYFRARAQGDPDAVESWLGSYPGTRLAREAAESLVWARIDELAPREDSVRAIRHLLDAQAKDLVTTRAHDLMLDLKNVGETDLLIATGDLGVEHGRDDRYPDAVHHVHAELGHALLERGEARAAWRHLLSAAFGLPEEGPVHLDLGRYYEGEGRLRRAFSRYVQAVLSPDSGPAALAAMARLQPQLDDGEPFDVDLVDRMIGGRVKSFGSATRWEAPQEGPTRRVTLVEFFTSPSLGDGDAGAIGGALGNEGLLAHFQDAPVAFVTYCVPEPEPTPLVNAVAVETQRLLGAGFEHRIDGVDRQPGAGRWRDAEAIYERGRKSIDAALDVVPSFDLQLEAAREGDVVSGTLLVGGLEQPDARVQVLVVERGVLYPGKSRVVVHRRLARGSALGEALGVPFEPDDSGVQELYFECDLARLADDNERFLAELQASGAGTIPRLSVRIDPGQVELVAFVRDLSTGAILQAARVVPRVPEESQ